MLAAEGSERVRIEISDTGRGIAAEDIAKIFEPYFSTKETGTGLGLAMCKRIVEQSNGSIWFETSDGGTSFFILFPINDL